MPSIQIFSDSAFLRGSVTRSAVVAAIAGAAAASDFQVIDLGTLGGALSSATALNESGDVAGVSTVIVGEALHAFRWSGGTMIDLGALPNHPQSSAFAINAAGDVVGLSYSLGELDEAAVIWRGAGAVDSIGAFTARSINDLGIVVGVARPISNAIAGMGAVRWENGASQMLGTLGGDASAAHAINDVGWIVGQSEPQAARPPHAFVWINGAMHDLGTLGGDYSVANDVNGAGQVVGVARRADGVMHAFRFEVSASGVVTQRTDLGDLGGQYSAAYGINRQGLVVGTSFDRAFLYQGGVMTNLNDRIPAGSGWVLTRATAINDRMQIVGEGRHNGSVRAFLLNPPPALAGDMNCDGFVTVGDVGGFVLALTDPAGYAAQYPACDIQNADMNQDGFITVGDIGLFVLALTGE
ncbi:MAG: hypothetical protein SF069_13940 [Phycisphaerae bacterium]|nr:hypothetical protein [Phycisphaerae bacterium]